VISDILRVEISIATSATSLYVKEYAQWKPVTGDDGANSAAVARLTSMFHQLQREVGATAMDHVLFEAVQTVQPRQKRSSTLDAAPPMRTCVISRRARLTSPTASQIGANLSRERQLMAASGEAVGVVTALQAVRVSSDAEATPEPAPVRARRSDTAGAADADTRAVTRTMTPQTLSSSSSAAAGNATPAGSMLQLMVSVFYSPPEDDVKAFAQRFASSVLSAFCDKHADVFLSTRLARLLRSCEATEDQAELKKLHKQITKKFLDVDITSVERKCSEDRDGAAQAQAKTLKRSQVF
jgi:hypothetical protein